MNSFTSNCSCTKPANKEIGQCLRMCGTLVQRPFMDVTIFMTSIPALIDKSLLQTQIDNRIVNMMKTLLNVDVNPRGEIEVQFFIGNKSVSTLCKLATLEENIHIRLGMDVLPKLKFRMRFRETTLYGHRIWATPDPDVIEFAYNLLWATHLRKNLQILGYDLQKPYNRRNLEPSWKNRRNYYSRFRDA